MMFSDEELRRGARELSIAIADELPTWIECDHTFSPAFTRCMKRLSRRSRHPLLHSAIRSAAGFVLALLVGSGIWLTLDTEAREAFFGWIGERIESTHSYFFDGSDTNEIPQMRYRLNEIPEGYWEEGAFETIDSVDVTYKNDEGQYFSLGYIFRPTENSRTEISFCDTSKMEKTVVRVNNEPADCFVDPVGEIGNVLVWQDRETGALLYISGYFDQNTLILMAEEVVVEEK